MALSRFDPSRKANVAYVIASIASGAFVYLLGKGTTTDSRFIAEVAGLLIAILVFCTLFTVTIAVKRGWSRDLRAEVTEHVMARRIIRRRTRGQTPSYYAGNGKDYLFNGYDLDYNRGKVKRVLARY